MMEAAREESRLSRAALEAALASLREEAAHTRRELETERNASEAGEYVAVVACAPTKTPLVVARIERLS